MNGRKTWLEVALNGPWSRRLQPGIPVTRRAIVDEAIACVRAGAAIVHVHGYDEATGRQRDDAEVYAAIIGDIRDRVDAIVYPTIPLAGGADAAGATTAVERFAAVEALAARGLLEWAVVDPGSVNFAHRADLAQDRPGFVYLNPEQHIRHGLDLAARHRFHPSYACYEPGFVRLGAALHARRPDAPAPIYRFMFSDDYMFGFPPEPYALAALLELLRRAAPDASWMAAGLAVDIRPLIAAVVGAGGHVRVGLEDAPFGSALGNVAWVEAAAAAIAGAGGTLTTAAEVRMALGTPRSLAENG